MSSSSDSDSEYDILKIAMYERIANVHSAGSFATFGTVENFVHPGISVDPIGIVRLPLSEDDAHALAQASRPASFGKGTETLVDESVRRTWEIDAQNVQFLNKAWHRCLDQTVQNAARELGVASGSRNVRAEFYKMLLYEKGAMFKAHKDTEKVSGMFGTLVICLPSAHTGGAVCLQHGRREAKFETSASSAFGTTFIAWYADVTHEIEPVQTGYRWVITYNLISDPKDPAQSASTLDARIGDFTQGLTEWHDLEDRPQFLVYSLAHQYTNEGLRLAQLKGDDYYRARHVAQSSAEHGQFYVLLANFEMCITNPNDDQGENQRSFSRSLTHIVDLEGLDLSVCPSLGIHKTMLLQERSYDDSNPDTQRGGQFMGNQYAEIDKIYEDSVMILVPKCSIISFLFGNSLPVNNIKRLIERLKERTKRKSDDPISQDLLLRICQHLLSAKYNTNELKDLGLGLVAVTAIFMRDAALFRRTVEQTSNGFDKDSYIALGESTCLQTVSEDDITEALTKSGKLHEICDNLDSFRNGFSQGNPDREDQLRMRHLKQWLDSIAFKSLSELTKPHVKDASTLIRIIHERGDDEFKDFVFYQGVKKFVDRFLHDGVFTNALIIELLFYFQGYGSSQKFLESLLQRILEPAVSNFDLQQYAAYVEARYSQGLNNTETRNVRAGPIKAFYERVRAYNQDAVSRLLEKIQIQASNITKEQLKNFLMPFIGEIIPTMDVSTFEAQGFFQSLVITYITRTVGKEPKKPSDWTRSEEIGPQCHTDCGCGAKMIDFLMDPKAKTHEISCKKCIWKLKGSFHWFEYFEVEEVDYEPATVTKTEKWWEKHHKEWESRASIALRAIRELPQAELKKCLSDGYDEIMDLRMVKDDDGSAGPESTSKEQHRNQIGSIVPQKRLRSSS